MIDSIKSGGGAQKAALTKKSDKSGASKVAGSGFSDAVRELSEKDDEQQNRQNNPQEQAERGKEWAQNTLKDLDLLRIDLMSGRVPKSRLVSLAAGDDDIFRIDNPNLKDLLEEIRLRASVEKAKYLQ